MLIVQILQGLMEGVFLFLIASGLTLIFGVSRIVNFAHGSFYMLGAFLTYQVHPWIAAGTPGGFFTSILVCGVLVALIGLAFELVFLRRVYHAEELMQLVLTLAAVLIIRDLTKVLLGARRRDRRASRRAFGGGHHGRHVPPYLPARHGDSGDPRPRRALWAVLKFTRAGIVLRAATDDRGMVALLGINQAYVFTAVFTVGSFLAGIAGGFAAAFESVNYLLDARVIVLAFIVVVIGGLGSLYGALFAALGVGVVKSLGLLWAPRLSMVIIFLLMAVVLLFRSLRRTGE